MTPRNASSTSRRCQSSLIHGCCRPAASHQRGWLAGRDQYVYYTGSDHAVHLWLYSASRGTWANQTLGGTAAAGTSPDALTNATGDLYTYYVGSDHAIHLWLWNGSTWANQDLGGTAAASGSPSGLAYSTGCQEIYYAGGDGAIHL